MQGLAKMMILPAKRLESFASDMKRKGRIQPGAEADIVVFDADKIIDPAAYTEPGQYSAGVHSVLVDGTPVVDDGRVITDVHTG